MPDVKGRFFISRQGSNTLCDSEQPDNRAVVRRYRGDTDYGRRFERVEGDNNMPVIPIHNRSLH